MVFRSGLALPIPRALVLAVGLAANLFAAGVPTLHALAHHSDHGHHALPPTDVTVQGEHDEVHPSELHDDWLLRDQLIIDLATVIPARTDAAEPPRYLFEAVPLTPALVLESRPPPFNDAARAPPIV
jgi:hypothetical protein